MIQSNQKTSLLVPYELPKFISEDPNYANFTLFIKAYYEWMEEQGNVLDFTKSIPSLIDIDSTTQEFLQYYINDFMSYFPQDILADPVKTIKAAKQLYQNKGTPASFEFLFRILYNSDVDIFYNKDAVLKASGGTWYVPRSLKLATDDPNFLNTQNLRVFGNISKSIATIEASTYDGVKTEVFISNIERLFQSGETVTVVDNRNQPVYFKNGQQVPAGTVGAETLTALIVGQISQIIIDKNNRGLGYSVGDPVVFYGGLNPNTPNPVGATAVIGSVTTGSIQSIHTDNEGYGYTFSTPNNIVGGANTQITFTNLVGESPKAPIVIVGGLDPVGAANATFVPVDSLLLKEHISLGANNYFFASGNYLTVNAPVQFANSEYIYQGTSLASNTFSGKIVNMDPANNVLLLVSNTTGTISNSAFIIGANTGAKRYISAWQGQGTNNVRIQYSNGQFYPSEGVYQGTNLANSSFSAGIVNISTNSTGNVVLQLNNVVGTVNLQQQLHGYVSQSYANTINIAYSNANTPMGNAFSFTSFQTYPISSLIVENQGGGFTQPPTIEVNTFYNEDEYSISNLANLGILAPVKIRSGGTGYSVGDTVLLAGGSGVGAYAQVTSVNASTGAITSITYVQQPLGNSANPYPLGGMCYYDALPTPIVVHTALGNVTTSNASTIVTGNGTSFNTQINVGGLLVTNSNVILGTVQSVVNANTLILTSNATTNVVANSFYLGTAILSVDGYLGAGATFSEVANRIGSIITFNILDNGDDYIAAPNVSLAIQDLIVSNVYLNALPQKGQTVFQGANLNVATYIATVDSIFVVEQAYPANNSVYQMRVYNYTSKPANTAPLKITSINASMNLVPNFTNIRTTTFDNSTLDTRFDAANGIMQYGDGHALATTTFLNGLVIGNGQYLNNSGQPSGYDVLQSTEYNNYTYEITVEKEIAKYRDVLMNLLHPTGMRVIGRYSMRSNDNIKLSTVDALQSGVPLDHYANTGTIATISAGTPTNKSNNIITFANLYGANLSNIFFANTTTVVFEYGTGLNDSVKSLVVNVGNTTITLQDNVWTYFGNVAVSQQYGNSNTELNITSLTGTYNLINYGAYSNTTYPMMDVIRVNDNLYINGAAQTVVSINYTLNQVGLSGPLANGSNGLISIGRSMISTYENVQVFGPVGTQYFVMLTDENGNTLTDEQGNELLIG